MATFGKPTLPNWQPVTVTEVDDFIVVDNQDGLLWRFRTGTFGYNEIQLADSTPLIVNELWYLEYKQGQQWKPRGIPQSVTWEQPESYHVIVRRHYTDFIGTTFVMEYNFYGGFRPKITFKGTIGTADNYRIRWSISGINKTYYQEITNGIQFYNDGEQGISFDYSDVHRNLGDITTYTIDANIKNHKLDLYFIVGNLPVGEFRLDPTFGKTGIGGSTNAQGAVTKYGSKFTLVEEGNISKISAYLKANAGTVNGKAAIYSDNAGAPNALQGSTQQTAGIDTTPAWHDYTFAAPLNLGAGVYWLIVVHDAACTEYYDAGAANQYVYKSGVTYGDEFTDPFGAPGGYVAWESSIYATYEAVAGGISVPVAYNQLITHISKKIKGG